MNQQGMKYFELISKQKTHCHYADSNGNTALHMLVIHNKLVYIELLKIEQKPNLIIISNNLSNI